MKIIDLIKKACELLSLQKEIELLNSAEIETETELLKNLEINKLFNLSKFSIQELCTNYVPMQAEAQITTANKTYSVGELTNFIRVQNVYKDKKLIKYKLINRKLTFAEDGNYTVKYLTYPEIESVFDDLDFLSHLSPDVLVFGLCAYYCLSKGLFDDFKIYNEKYIERAESIKNLKIIDLPQRRWQWRKELKLKNLIITIQTMA